MAMCRAVLTLALYTDRFLPKTAQLAAGHDVAIERAEGDAVSVTHASSTHEGGLQVRAVLAAWTAVHTALPPHSPAVHGDTRTCTARGTRAVAARRVGQCVSTAPGGAPAGPAAAHLHHRSAACCHCCNHSHCRQLPGTHLRHAAGASWGPCPGTGLCHGPQAAAGASQPASARCRARCSRHYRELDRGTAAPSPQGCTWHHQCACLFAVWGGCGVH